ncbi:MAG: tRNA threonylcarbamoyladenosine dehydratase [Bacteroidales bacterium]|jgi:tRNA A37 threonylcarbamoyladenosine dehydratase|nr:tRNA threonylcarbamoyladenosine dehydratase [Bacteroidales bacterium]
MDWLDRTKLLLGEEKLVKLASSHVLVAGLGGVGAYAAEQLCRAGVGTISIVDNDIINLTNINRQLIALNSNLNRPKVEVLAERLQDINPQVKVYQHNMFLKDEDMLQVLINKYDYVIDAIDTLSPKIYLIKLCVEKEIPIVSSMGSGGKTNPESVKISDISKSYNCSLARILRKRLHRLGIYKGIDVVFSSEKADKSSVVLEESENKKSNVGTISYMPAIFGCFAASVVIRNLCEI